MPISQTSLAGTRAASELLILDMFGWLVQEAVNSHRQAGLKVLVRLQGQGSDGQPLGPWALDVEQKSMKEVSTPQLALQSVCIA